MSKPILMSWDLTTRASIQETWKALSDTDRFNRVAEAGFTFTPPADPTLEGARTQGSIKKLGMTITWDEQPFSFRAPNWFRVERRFHSGPAEKLIATARLTKRPEGGTRIEYNLEVTPRGFFTRAILGFDLKGSTEPKVGKALRLLVQSLDLDASVDPYTGAAAQLTPEAEKRLGRSVKELAPSPYAERLAGFLRAGPERDQARIAASTLALAWHAELEDVMNLLLTATDIGMLGMTLDLLCPACLVPRRELGPGANEVHCESCNIRYDASFPELLVVHFRPSPQIRPLNVRIECLGSPAQSAHILAQETLDPGQEADLATDLEPGMHQIRTLPALGAPALLEISLGGHPTEVRFSCKNMVHPQLARASNPRHITFTNASDKRVTVVLERVTRPPQMVTAGRLYAEFPRFRKLAPVLPFFSKVECYRAAVLSLAVVDGAVATAASGLGRARFTYISDRTILAVYDSYGALLDDAIAGGLLASGSLPNFAGASVGMIFDLPRDGRRIPMGPAVDDAYVVMQGAGFGNLALPVRLANDPEIVREQTTHEITIEPHAYRAGDGQEIVRLAHA